jgi:hypothetical protein
MFWTWDLNYGKRLILVALVVRLGTVEDPSGVVDGYCVSLDRFRSAVPWRDGLYLNTHDCCFPNLIPLEADDEKLVIKSIELAKSR